MPRHWCFKRKYLQVRLQASTCTYQLARWRIFLAEQVSFSVQCLCGWQTNVMASLHAGQENVQWPLHLTMPLHINFKVFFVLVFKVEIAEYRVWWNKNFTIIMITSTSLWPAEQVHWCGREWNMIQKYAAQPRAFLLCFTLCPPYLSILQGNLYIIMCNLWSLHQYYKINLINKRLKENFITYVYEKNRKRCPW